MLIVSSVMYKKIIIIVIIIHGCSTENDVKFLFTPWYVTENSLVRGAEMVSFYSSTGAFFIK